MCGSEKSIPSSAVGKTCSVPSTLLIRPASNRRTRWRSMRPSIPSSWPPASRISTRKTRPASSTRKWRPTFSAAAGSSRPTTILGSDYRGGGGNVYTSHLHGADGRLVGARLRVSTSPANPIRSPPRLRLRISGDLGADEHRHAGIELRLLVSRASNDGGAGGGFEPAAYRQAGSASPTIAAHGTTPREIDLGFCGSLSPTAATLLTDDEIFGRVCLGGDWRATFDGPKSRRRTACDAASTRCSTAAKCNSSSILIASPPASRSSSKKTSRKSASVWKAKTRPSTRRLCG